MLRIDGKLGRAHVSLCATRRISSGLGFVQKNRMAAENEPGHEHPAPDQAAGDHAETLATSLTDLIDEMDRAAFLRSLSSRHLKRPLEIDVSALRARPKTP